MIEENMIKVSIIVPVYNASSYLKKCFDTLINQTLEEIEIVAVNDGSTDNSLEILNEYKSKHPDKITILSKENGRQGSARNAGLLIAKGEYIGYVDADDYADIDMFKILYEKAKERDYDIVFCDHYKINRDKSEYVTFKDYQSKKDMVLDVLVSPWNKLIKRELLLSSKVTFPENTFYEDTAWFIELIPFFNMYTVVHKPLLYHIVQPNSSMTAKDEMRVVQIFSVMNHVVAFYVSRDLMDEYGQEIEYFYTRILLMSSLRRIAKIKDRHLKKLLTHRTFCEIKSRFPRYKKNKYLKGKKGLYIKLLNEFTVKFVLFLYSFK